MGKGISRTRAGRPLPARRRGHRGSAPMRKADPRPRACGQGRRRTCRPSGRRLGTPGPSARGCAGAAGGRGDRGGGAGAAGGPGLRAVTHLSELEGGDDGDHDAHETDVEPIPVGQAGIGLSLQELEQHHPGRRHATPGGARARAAASTSRHSAAPSGPPRSDHDLRPPRMAAPGYRRPLGSAPRPPLPGAGAHALGAAEADRQRARRPAPP